MHRYDLSKRLFSLVFAGVLVTSTSYAANVASLQDKWANKLLQAAKDDDRNVVRSLIAKHVDVNAQQGDGFTPLHWAAYNDDVELTKLLLRAGAKAEARTRLEGNTPLFLAAINGDAELIEVLLAGGASVKTANDNGTTVLMEAAAAGAPDAVLALLKHGADVNQLEKTYGQNALFFAATHGRGDTIRILVEHGADTSVKTNVQKLERVSLSANFDEMPADSNGAAAGPNRGGGGGVGAEGAAGAGSPRGRGGAGRGGQDVPADGAAPTANGKVLTMLDGSAKTLPGGGSNKPGGDAPAGTGAKDEPDAYGFTRAERTARAQARLMGGLNPLHTAARDGQLDAIRALLDEHADINAQTDTDKSTPLLLAIVSGHYDVAKYLIDHGANVKLASTDGLGPLYATIDVQWAPHTWYPQPVTAQEKTSYPELLNLLLAHGADVNTKLMGKIWFRVYANDETWVDVTGATPFWRAAYAGDLAVMKVLAEHGADTNAASKSDDSPFMVAAGLGWAAYWTQNAPYPRLDAVKFLLEHGADINKRDAKGYSAIHGAAFRGDNAMIDYLLAHGADLNVVSKQGDTVADSANGLFEHATVHPDTVALLENLGSKSSNNCRSNECVVPPKQDRPPGAGRGNGANGANAEPGPTAAAAEHALPPTTPEQK